MIGRRKLLEAAGLALAFSPSRRALADELLRQGRDPQNLATPTALFDRLITPTPSFFVRSHFGPPALDRERPLRVDGLVAKALTLDAAELERSFSPVTVTAVLQCAGNGRAFHEPRVPGLQWTHGAMGQATFTGVRLRDLLRRAGVAPENLAHTHVHVLGADGPPKPSTPAFLRSIPIERALDPTTLVAYKMNGEALTLAHGAPLRLVVPGWAGDHWVKWLTKLSVQKAEATGFYMATAYRMPTEKVTPGAAVPPEKMRPATTFPVKSIIGSPADGGRAPAGPQRVAGVAFSGDAPIAKVEVSIDDGKTWRAAKLEGEPGAGRWVVFEHRFDRTEPGRVRALARATDRKGNTQPERAAWNPSGYHWNAWHAVSWEVL
ncbi:MAG: sulfite oxidase [Labilithrix sp.]|nr:sulfite oxidase [Labilithrix sp.]